MNKIIEPKLLASGGNGDEEPNPFFFQKEKISDYEAAYVVRREGDPFFEIQSPVQTFQTYGSFAKQNELKAVQAARDITFALNAWNQGINPATPQMSPN